MLRELTICATLATLLELACIGGFVFATLVLGMVPWL
jgi:hypothetical protein